MHSSQPALKLSGRASGVLRASLVWLVIYGCALATALATSPYAVQIVSATGPFGPSPYDDANAVLGEPATWFYDPFGAFSGGTTDRRVKITEAAYNISPTTNNPITPNLIVTLSGGSRIVARFDHPVQDNPANPYGLDLLVFGNSFYTASGAVHDGADLNTLPLTGGVSSEPIKVSVSPGYTGQPGENPDDPDTWPWYRYDNGPYGDTGFPTEAFRWNRAVASWTDDLMDFTKPVNPAMATPIAAGGLSAADAVDLYVGSGGGTGFDLRESGFPWIQYVKVEGIDPDFSDGEIDAFAIVRPMLVGDALSITPENVLSNTATLCFQKPGAESESQVVLKFNSVSDLAQVATTPLTNFMAFAPLPGAPLNAVQITLSPILGTDAVTFAADLALSAGTNYHGTGGDLLVLQADGTNWNFLPFTFTNHLATVLGVTNLSAFVVAQIAAPAIHLTIRTNGCVVSFLPVAGLSHTLERSTNLVAWTSLTGFTATNSQPARLTDNAPPRGRVFYRLRLERP